MAPMLTETLAAAYAQLAMTGIAREFPNKPDHVLLGPDDARTPRQLHPAFHGCYDWHSAVHGHWLLLRLRRRFPAASWTAAANAALRASLTAANLRAEADYAATPGREAFERPYGWAWIFALADELAASSAEGHAESAAWLRHLDPLLQHFRARLLDWLPRQRLAIRAGIHGNTAFLLDFALQYSGRCGDAVLSTACADAARRFFAADAPAPLAWEPSGNDFLSPALSEAVLMQRVLAPDAFRAWLAAFVPTLTRSALMSPVDVTDRNDAQGGHLDGLNLSRAWHLARLANHHDDDDALRVAAAAHVAAALPHVSSGNFLGEHWLATFATLALDGV